MSGFARALRGELYLLTRRSSVRRAHLLVVVVAILHVMGSMWVLQVEAGLEGIPADELAAWNFWPRLAAGARAAMYFVELLVLALIAGSFPREIAGGVTRDPATRRISRRALLGARAIGALLLSFSLYGTAVLAAAFPSYLLFDRGPVMEDGDILLEELEILEPVVMALVHGLPSVLALGAFACLLSVAFHRGVVASGVGLGMVLATGIFHEAFGDAAPLWFADTLAGFGPDSFLEQAAGFSQGLLNFYPESFNAVVDTGWWSPLPALVLSVYAALFIFHRRAL
ncbi:MAG: hypothetical protein MK209_05220 [Planctomycetes bacterium]|nr:hypothetical protein [Planctomycetota bacterium]